jgi:bifunctional non-homologous end joining protein LigD
MSLTAYRSKRRFAKTPEPAGGRTKRAARGLCFVVQKHDASRLHYDFRLEMDGVLKSWAVPKGPSLDPSDKRLAVQVEDHPFDYRTFEGIIPAGNYGAGAVMVWDEGTYEPAGPHQANSQKQLLSELENGHLRFVLHGAKLRGEFSLVRMKGDKGKNWLLMKHRDEFATQDNVLLQDRSVATDRDLTEIADGAPKKKSKSARPRRPGGKRTSKSAVMPHNIKPMLATLIAEPFDGDDWLFEVKWDGYRAIAEVEDGNVRLYSRNLLPLENKFPPIIGSLKNLGHDAVLDGEIVVLDAQGKAHFQLLQTYHQSGGTLAYYVFDLLYLDGTDLRSLPLRQRKNLLPPLLRGLDNIRVSEHIEGDGVAFFAAAMRQGLEGVIAKEADSAYQEGLRSRKWLKLKARQQQDAVIGGFTEPRGSRQGLGALVLGVYEGKDLVYIGHAGGGFDSPGLRAMRARLEPLVQRGCPFKEKPKTNAPVHWVTPTQVCEVAFLEWTADGTLRQPIFLGLREDKPAQTVKRERPTPAPAPADAKPSSGDLPPGKYTNLQKIYWPAEGYTKGNLLAYYHEIASFILPYLSERPLSLHRHPNGIDGPSFFQKDLSSQPPPDWVKTISIASESAGKDINYLVCQDEPTLLYVANLGCIEMNPWNSRVATLDRPDYLVIDLDPEGVPFRRVVETAQAIRKLLERGCGAGCCKTSGKRGLHVYVPLAARYDYDQARQFAEIVARQVNAMLPEATSLVRAPAQRQGKIYLDYLQNRRGQTMAAPYSLRPVAGALVSTPLRWSEVTKSLDPSKFTLKSMPRRLEKLGDLWSPVLGKGIDLERMKTAYKPKT